MVPSCAILTQISHPLSYWEGYSISYCQASLYWIIQMGNYNSTSPETWIHFTSHHQTE